MTLVFDDTISFHQGIARRYHIHPIGGGTCRIDSDNHAITLRGTSKAYGAEPRREMTKRALLSVFPDWHIAVE